MALTTVAQLVGYHPAKQKDARSIPSQGHMSGLQARSPVGGAWEATMHWCFSPFLSPSLSFSLKINTIFFKNKNDNDWNRTCLSPQLDCSFLQGRIQIDFPFSLVSSTNTNRSDSTKVQKNKIPFWTWRPSTTMSTQGTRPNFNLSPGPLKKHLLWMDFCTFTPNFIKWLGSLNPRSTHCCRGSWKPAHSYCETAFWLFSSKN